MKRGFRLVALGLAMAFPLVVAGCGGGGSSGGGPSVAAPDGVAAVAGDAQVTVSWNPVTGADSYNLYWDTMPGVAKTDNPTPGVSNPFIHTGLTNGQTYYYRVTAVDGTVESSLSVEVMATPQLGCPSAPTAVVATAGDSEVTISFIPGAGAAFHNLYWDTSPGVGLGSNKIPGVTSPYVHTALTNGLTYYYRLTAENAACESPLSSEVSATPQASAPPCPAASVVINGQPMTFSDVRHAFLLNGGNILMDVSSPIAGWQVTLVLNTGADQDPGTPPGSPVDSCSVTGIGCSTFNPAGDWYVDNPCVNDITMQFSAFTTIPGQCTTGTFSGTLEKFPGVTPLVTLTGGVFSATRQ